jgi:vesicular inhibitory amino acid transporter
VLFSPICLGVIAVWNYASAQMMLQSKRVCLSLHFPEGLASTYSKIAFAALGWWGVYVVDVCVVITLLGVCVSYQVGFAQLVAEIPGGLFSSYKSSTQTALLIGLSGVVLLPIICFNNIQILAKISLGGLAALVVGIAVIIFFGFYQSSETVSILDMDMSPQSVADFTTFIGISAFCFGICALG